MPEPDWLKNSRTLLTEFNLSKSKSILLTSKLIMPKQKKKTKMTELTKNKGNPDKKKNSVMMRLTNTLKEEKRGNFIPIFA